MNHPVDCFVDSPVAARYQNQTGSAIHGAAGNLAGVARPAGGNGIDSDTSRVEQLDASPQLMASPSESARVRIINKYGLTVGVDSTLIIIDVTKASREFPLIAIRP